LAGSEQARVLRRLRTQWREIARRDFFPPPQRENAAAALRALAGEAAPGTGPGGGGGEGDVVVGADRGNPA
jgi:hypothetical protein